MKTAISITQYLLLVSAIFFATETKAQESINEYFPQGTTWEEAEYHFKKSSTWAEYTYFRYTVDGDSIVNDTVYKRVLISRRILDSFNLREETGDFWYSYDDVAKWFYWDNIGPYHWEPMANHTFCLREEGGKVYIRYWRYGKDEKLVYDFNWEEGKQITEWNPSTKVEESYTLDGIKEVILADGSVEQGIADRWNDDITMIRGIGRLSGLFMGFGTTLYDGFPQFTHLISFTRNGFLTYQWDAMQYLEEQEPDFSECYPEGTTWEEAYYHYPHDGNPTNAAYVLLRYTVSGDTIGEDYYRYKRVIVEKKVLDSYSYSESEEGCENPYICVYEVNPADFSWEDPGPFHWERLPSNDFGIREENGVVFVLYWKYGGFGKLFYDFNWEAPYVEEWDTASGSTKLYETESNIRDVTLLDGTRQQALTASGGEDFVIIKSIGNLGGLFKRPGILVDDGTPEFAHVLTFAREDTLLYEWNALEYLGVNGMSMPASEVPYAIYDLQGRRLRSVPSKGLYISGGKKYHAVSGQVQLQTSGKP